MKKLFIFLNFITILLTGHYAFAQCYISEPVISVDGVETYDGQIIDVCVDQWINLEGSVPNVGNGETAEWSGAGLNSTAPSESVIFLIYGYGDFDVTWTFYSSIPGCDQISRTVTFRAKDVPPQPVITGRTEVCEDSEENYSVFPVQKASDYIWTISDTDSIIYGQYGLEIIVAFGSETTASEKTSTPVQIQVTANNKCGPSIPATLTIEKSNCNVLGFNNELSNHFYSIFPNPFTTSFTLEGISDFDKIEVFNLSGQLVETYFTNNNLGESLETGTYLVKIHVSDRIEVRKLMKH